MKVQFPSAGHTAAPQRILEFFLARQPILNRRQTLVAYELLFRNAAVGPANIANDLTATAAVIAHASRLGLESVVGDAIAYLNVDEAVLASDIFRLLPREKVVLEIVESAHATPALLERVADLAAQGFCFALDDVTADNDDVRQLLPHVHIVKFDLCHMPPSALIELVPGFRAEGKKLLAEKVEDKEQFDLCLELGFDFFQGYYFAKPIILSGKKLSSSQLEIVQLSELLNSDADNKDIERAIKPNVSLCFDLLRLANNAAFGARRRIDSIAQALLVLGRSQLQRWLQIMLYAEPCRHGRSAPPLLNLAVTRGKLLELLAQQLEPDNRVAADTAFTVGIMSLMDTLFGMPMDEILDQLAVSDKVRLALLHRAGSYGELLQLAQCMERMEETDDALEGLVRRLGLTSEQLVALQLSAYAWSNEVTRAA